eukprot:552254-Lingulodinium_polyedra.AAC.1
MHAQAEALFRRALLAASGPLMPGPARTPRLAARAGGRSCSRLRASNARRRGVLVGRLAYALAD